MTPEQQDTEFAQKNEESRWNEVSKKLAWQPWILSLICIGLIAGIYVMSEATTGAELRAINKRLDSLPSDPQKQLEANQKNLSDRVNHLARAVILLSEANIERTKDPREKQVYTEILADVRKLGEEINAGTPAQPKRPVSRDRP